MRLFYSLFITGVLLFIANSGKAQTSYNMANQTVTDTVGYLYDDGGPSAPYSMADSVTFTIDVGVGKTIKFQWLEFSTESNPIGTNALCLFDYVELIDGDTTASLLNRYCGSSIPDNFEATSGKLTVRLISDSSNQKAGFKAYWTTGDLLAVDTTYCKPTIGTPCQHSWVKRFVMGNIDNNNDLCDKEYDGVNDDGFSDYTNQLMKLYPDSTYTITVEIGNSFILDRAMIWIDWNQNKEWEFTERIELAGTAYIGVNMFTGVVIPPIGAVTGQIGQIRVMSDFAEVDAALDYFPCESTFEGEVEDYSFILLDGQTIPDCVTYTNCSPVDSSANNCLNQTLRWGKVANATSYLVSLVDTLTGAKIVDSFSVLDTFYVVPTTLAPNTAYRWMALSVNGATPAFACDSADFTTSPNLDPIANITPSAAPIQACLNTPLNFDGTPTQGTAPYTHSWTGTGSVYLSSALIVNPVFTGTVVETSDTLIYTVKDMNNCSSTDTVLIDIIAEANPGVLSAFTPSPVCQGAVISLLVTGSSGTITVQDSISGGSWTDMTSTMNGDTIYITESNTGTVFFRTRAAGTNCSDLGTTVVSYSVTAAPPAPIVMLMGNDTICEGSSTQLMVTNYTTDLTWNDAAATQAATLNVTVSGNYQVTYTGGTCPSVSQINKILVAPVPVAAIDYAGNLTSCADDLPFLYTDPTATETVLWSNGVTAKFIYPSISGNYSALITNEFGCSKVTASLAVVIIPLPPKPVVTQIGSSNPCEGEPITLKSSYANGNHWNTGSVNDSIIVTSTGDYFVSFTNSSGCSAKSDTVKLIFRAAPIRPQIVFTGSVNPCKGDSIKLSVVTTPTSTWNTGVTNNNLIVYTTGSYYAHYVNTDGCLVYSDTFSTVFTQLQPEIKVTIVDQNFCQGNPVLLKVNTTDGNTWNDAASTYNDSLVVTQTGSYFVRNVMNTVCVAYSDTVDITYFPKPSAPGIVKSNDTLYCTVAANAYQWIGNEGPISNTNNIYYVPTHTGNYSVAIYSVDGCASNPSNQYFVGFTGIAKQTLTNVEVSPNPFDGYININKIAGNNAHFTITNQIGQVVVQGKLKQGDNTVTVDLSSGVYNLIISDSDKTASLKLIKY